MRLYGPDQSINVLFLNLLDAFKQVLVEYQFYCATVAKFLLKHLKEPDGIQRVCSSSHCG